MAAIAITPASGSVIAKVSVCRIDVTGVDSNDTTTYDAAAHPTEQAVRYRLLAHKSGQDNLVSPEFVTSAAGKWTWDNLLFRASGTWTIDLIDTRDGSTAATKSVVVTS